MAISSPGKPLRLVGCALWLAALGVGAYHLAVEVTAIALPEPMGMWETTYVAIARVFPHEYQAGQFVLGHDNYGPGYPAFCRPFLSGISDPYAAHRVANLAALAAAGGLVAWMLRRTGCTAAVAAALVALVYAINAGSYSIQARPDFLLLLLMTAVLAVGQRALRGRLPPLSSGALLGVLALAAYLTKPYSLFAWGAVLVAWAACLGLRYALLAGLVSGSLLAAGIALYARSNPYYLLETFHAHVAHTAPDFHWLVHQSGDFLLLALGPVLGLGAALLAMRKNPAPEPGPTEARYWGWISGLAAVALLAVLGWHTGAYLTYYIHLLLVPLCLCAASTVPPRSQLLPVALLANLAVLMFLAPGLPRGDPGWNQLADDVRHQPGRLVVDSLMEPLSHLRPDIRVADTGMGQYALDEPGLVAPAVQGDASARSEAASFAAKQADLLALFPPDALYLDFIAQPDPSGRPGDLVYSPRNGLPWFSVAYLQGFTAVRYFHLHPYYGATNERRQDAGTWETLVIKFVRPKRPENAGHH